jgi:hypothetical protein
MMKHRDQVLSLLKTQIGNEEEVKEIERTAEEVASRWVNPVSGGSEQTNGLIYGLVQSGKTGVLTVSGALGADEGYRTIIILTSDNDPLYEQTLGRVREAFPGVDIIGKPDFKDSAAFVQRIKGGTCAIVTTKNSKMLGALIENFKKGKVKGLSCLIIDDEADQASLNTFARKDDGSRSTINSRIAELRGFFEKNSYLQVTATPQALFLQTPDHDFRPRFTVLSHPGSDYVGGDDFFGDESSLVREFDIDDLEMLAPGDQPSPRLNIPASLLRALDVFMIGATFKRTRAADQNCAFLCHVSTRTADHKHIERLLRKYKIDLAAAARVRAPALMRRLEAAYNDLAASHPGLQKEGLEKLVEAIAFFSPGITVKLVNGETDEDVAVKSPYNLFVGGNKLGRGVTIKNLLVSYYGRNPKRPQADTVLQHARMYGYRRSDIGLLRLFLPRELHTVFKAIHKMERGLRDLIAQEPSEAFRGLYVENSLSATRKNVLVPGSIGVYSGGGNYNPAQITRDVSVLAKTEKINKKVEHLANKTHAEMSLKELAELIKLTVPDQTASEKVWDPLAVSESILRFSELRGHNTGYIYIDRDRDVRANRRETQGILEGGEAGHVPDDKVTLFLLRMKAGKSEHDSWWPQIRYAFAFAI